MSMNHDPELDEILQDQELLRIAGLLQATRRAEPPLDEAFRSSLRRQLMQKAWGMGEERTPWWQRFAGPPALAWAGAALGILLIGSVVVFTANQAPGLNDIVITSPVADAHAVQLQQPILVRFNQPMNHPSTEKAVQITPATYVAFSWSDNTLAVHPTGGALAPNTQYRVTIGPSAKTQSGQTLGNAKTITFVTRPSATPPPSPKPSVPATPTSQLKNDHRLAAKPAGTFYTPQWSADSATIYFVGANGALNSVSSAGGDVKTIVADGVSSPAIAPSGDRIAFIRGGNIQVLKLADGSTADLAPAAQVTALGWAKDQILWATSSAIFRAGPDGQSEVASIPQSGTVVSIAPDGRHAVYQDGQSFHVLDLATSKSRALSGAAAFLGWSPDGSRMLYDGNQETFVADTQGQKISSLLSGDVSWSSKDEILIGSDTNLYAVRPDGYGRTLLNAGTYRNPVWAPDGIAFTYLRGSVIWSASTTPLPAEPSVLDQASTVVSQFMNARIAQHADQAQAFLDSKGKQAYSSSGLALVISGDATFTRDYVVVQQVTDRNPDTARFVVRLVLSKGSLDVSEYEETLTLQRDQASQPFLIDQANASATRDIGKGAEVVSADVATGSIKVVFDSDLVSDTVADGVVLIDANGNHVGSQSTYANRTVVITGLNLTPGAAYRLAVLTSVQDVIGRSVPTEYDLTVVGPVTLGGPTPPSPEPSPTPSPSASPSPSPTPSG